jgi:hypothetical protein
MAAIGYLIRKSIKNWLLDLKSKPQYIVLIAFVGLMLLSSILGGKITDRNYNEAFVSSLFLVATLVFGGVTIYGGVSETRSFFRLADVNLMFPSPIRPSHVIVYAMIRNVSTLAFTMIIMVYQIGTLRFTLGMTPPMIALTFICIFLMLVMSLTTSMCIMLLCNGRPRRKTLIKGLLVAVLSLLLIYAVAAGKTYSGSGGLNMFTAICSNKYLDLIPIIGWTRGLFVALISLQLFPAIVYGCLCLALLIVEIVAISRTKSDYYEDVLDGASRREQVRQAVKDGKRAYIPRSSKEKTIRKIGINGGKGASVFMYKRLLEQRRMALGMLSFTTIIIAAAGIFMSVILHVSFFAFLGIAALLSVFLQRIHSWEGELTKIYIFLAPSEPERKLFFAILPDLFTSMIDSVFVFIIGFALFSTGLFSALTGAIAYLSVTVLITGSSVVVRRIFGSDTKNPLVQAFAVYLPMIVMGIGVVPAVIAQFIVSADVVFPTTAILVITLWNIFAAGLLLILGRGVLTKCSGN